MDTDKALETSPTESTKQLQELHDWADRLLKQNSELHPLQRIRLLRHRLLLKTRLILRKRYPHLEPKPEKQSGSDGQVLADQQGNGTR